MLIRAKLPLRKKAILICIFSLGIFITVIQIIRILTIKSLSNYLDSSKLILWSMVENNLGIIVASIPALAPLFKSLLDKSSQLASSQRQDIQHSPYSLRNIYRRKESHHALGIQSTVGTTRPRSKDTAAGNPWCTEGGSDEHLNNAEGIYMRTEISIETENREYGAG
jgi:hypothetical protein